MHGVSGNIVGLSDVENGSANQIGIRHPFFQVHQQVPSLSNARRKLGDTGGRDGRVEAMRGQIDCLQIRKNITAQARHLLMGPGKSGLGFKGICRSTFYDNSLNHPVQQEPYIYLDWFYKKPRKRFFFNMCRVAEIINP